MKVLLIKTSSMGDILHTLPALTEAGEHIPHLSFDWVVEEAFKDIPTWHPLVDRVITLPWRKIRKNPFSSLFIQTLKKFKSELRDHYDVIIDAQGLLKSAILTCFTKGVRCGGDFKSAREPLASVFYKKRYFYDANDHAIKRVRMLFSGVFNYPYTETQPHYGIHLDVPSKTASAAYVVFAHGTTWETKHWPELYWVQLAKKCSEEKLKVNVLWGNEAEKERAHRIAKTSTEIKVMPRMSLTEVASLLHGAKAVISVDTGISHLAAALAIPTISIYGATDPALTGTRGKHQVHLKSTFRCAPCLRDHCQFKKDHAVFPPCYKEITPDSVFEQIKG